MISATIVTTCMGRLHHLSETLPYFAATGLPVVVVDYSDPNRCGDWVDAQKKCGMPWEVTVVRVPDQQYFNASKARNAGAAVAKTEWIVYLDADRIIGNDFLASLAKVCQPGQMCLFAGWGTRNRNFNGIMIVRKQDIDAVGGWATIESMSYGFEDDCTALLLTKERGLSVVEWPGFLSHIKHDDELRTRHYLQKDLPTGHAENINQFQYKYGKRYQEPT